MANIQLVLLLLVLSAFAKFATSVTVTETRKVSNFHAIELTGPFDMNIDRSLNASESVRVVADFDNVKMVEAIRTTVDRGILMIWFGWPELLPPVMQKGSVHLYVSARYLDKLTFTGSGIIQVNAHLTARTLDVMSYGSSSIHFSNVTCTNFNLQLNGAGLVSVNGKSRYAQLITQGAGTIDANNFVVDDAKAYVSGIGSIVVNVKAHLYALVAGMGSVRYRGDPEVESSTTGLGTVTKII